MQKLLLTILALFATFSLHGAQPRRVELTVDGVTRTALVFAPLLIDVSSAPPCATKSLMAAATLSGST